MNNLLFLLKQLLCVYSFIFSDVSIFNPLLIVEIYVGNNCLQNMFFLPHSSCSIHKKTIISCFKCFERQHGCTFYIMGIPY